MAIAGRNVINVNSPPQLSEAAVVNGGTDINIQAAIDGLTAGRTWREKVVLRGNFTINEPIVIPSYTYIEIIGTLTAGGANFESGDLGILVIGTASTRQTDIYIKGGTLEGDRTNVSNHYHSGIYCYYAKNVIIDGVTMNSNRNHGIDVVHTYDFIIQNCNSRDNGDDCITVHDNSYGGTIFNNICVDGQSLNGAGSSGIEIEGTNGASVTSMTRSGTTVTVTQTAHKYSVGDKITVSGANETDYNGVHAVATTADADTWTFETALTPATPATGTLLSGAGPSSLSIIGNIISEMPLAGIAITSDTGVISSPTSISLTGNTIYNTDTIGISLQGVTGNWLEAITVEGNTIRDSGAGSTTAGAINATRASGISITNNTVKDYDDIGIRLAEISGASINGNTINNATGFAMRITATADNCSVVGNNFRNCGSTSAWAMQLDGDTSCVISDNTFVDDQSTQTMKGLSLSGTPANLLITNNYFDVLGDGGGKRGIAFNGAEGANIEVKDNVWVGDAHWVDHNKGKATGISSGGTVAHGVRPDNSTVDFQCTLMAYTVAPTNLVFTVDATNITATFGGGGTIDFAWAAQFPVPV